MVNEMLFHNLLIFVGSDTIWSQRDKERESPRLSYTRDNIRTVAFVEIAVMETGNLQIGILYVEYVNHFCNDFLFGSKKVYRLAGLLTLS
jgi:hypothetical protein